VIKIRKIILTQNEFNVPGIPAVACTKHQLDLINEFNRKAKQKQVKFEEVPCLCGCGVFDLIARVDRYGMLQDTVACVDCGLVQSNPRMTQEEYFNYYSSDLYRSCYDGADYLAKYESKYTLKHGLHIFDAVNKVTKILPGSSVLELGAGGGWNLLPFKRAGASVLGVDYSPSLVELGNKHGIPMVRGTVDQIKGLYDVIVLNHVLEHFLQPVKSLKMLAEHIKADGIIYIAVPNILNFSIGQLQNAHPYYFSPYTFEHYCSLAGLGLIKAGRAQRIHMFGIFKRIEKPFLPESVYRQREIDYNLVRFKTCLKRVLRQNPA